MPDIGGFVRRAKQAAGKGGAGEEPEAEEDSGSATASAAEVTEETGRLRALLERTRPGPGPVTGRWSLGLGDLLAEHPKVPKGLRGLVRKLNRYGGLALTERSVEFDGEHVEWSAVTEIRTRNLVEYLGSDAVDQRLDAVPLPWFPGRRRVLDAFGKAVLALLVAAAEQQLDGRAADIHIPAEVHYRGTLRRRRELVPGVLAALVLADPAVNRCLVETAAAHGIAVLPA